MDKYIKDYYKLIQEKFPGVPKKDIQNILKYGFRSLYLHIIYGGDVCISSTSNSLWIYIGFLKKNSLEFFKYYRKKLIFKFRILYKRYKTQWDGYYYFNLTDEEYQDLVNIKKGRKRKYYTYYNKYLFKLLDECKVRYCRSKYYARCKYPIDNGFVIYKEKYKCELPEVIIENSGIDFKDLLITNNEYNYI